jgi:hypothetical protein
LSCLSYISHNYATIRLYIKLLLNVFFLKQSQISIYLFIYATFSPIYSMNIWMLVKNKKILLILTRYASIFIFIDTKMCDILQNQFVCIVYVDCRQIIRLIVWLTMKETRLNFKIVLYIIFWAKYTLLIKFWRVKSLEKKLWKVDSHII